MGQQSMDQTQEGGAAQFRRTWGIVTAAGLLGTIYYNCCLVGAPQTRFLVELGATPFDFGLISGLGAMALVCQLLAGVWANRLRHRKPVWMTLFILHRLAFVGVLAAPGLFDTGRARIGWIIGVLVVHNVLTHLGDPLWLSWMGDLVPEQGFNQHWARRQRVIRMGAIVAQVAVALWFGRYEASGQVIQGFVLLGLFGLVVGIIDIAMFAAVPEPEHDVDHAVRLRDALMEPVRDPEFRAFLVFRAYWMFAIMVGAPFFIVYLIREVGLSARTVQLLMVVHGLGMVLFSGVWGRICDTHGYRPVLQFVVMFKFVVPLTYVLVPPVPHIAVPVLAVMFFFDGLLNAAGILALQGVTMRSTPRRNRAMYVASSNFVAQGLAGGFAPLFAGALIEPLTGVMCCDFGLYHFTGFHVIFLISSILRGMGLILVNRLKEPDSGTLAGVLSQLSPIGFLGLRLPQR